MGRRIYLDNAATTLISDEVLQSIRPFLTYRFGNPSSSHVEGRDIREAVENARKQVAGAIGANPSEVYFTSGGTESNNWAVKGIAFATNKRTIITTNIEHPSIRKSCEWLEWFGYKTVYVKADREGYIDPQKIEDAITDDVCLISVMMANNEIGTIEPISEIGRIAEKHGIYFHVDAVQAVGAVPINVGELGVDLLSMSGHKFRGPMGTGALYIMKGIKIGSLIHGGRQERLHRAGTENVPGIVGMGAAIEYAVAHMEEHRNHLELARTFFLRGLDEAGIRYRLNGGKNRLPNNLNLTFVDSRQDNLQAALDYYGVACSSGSACSSGGKNTSAVLKAIGIDEETARKTVRFTLSEETDKDDIRRTIEAIKKCVNNE